MNDLHYEHAGALTREELQAAARLVEQFSNVGRGSLNLVPSENRMSPIASAVLTTDFYHRYFFNSDLDPNFWQFRGAQEVGHLELSLARASLARQAEVTHVNVRPISGMSAMLIALAALGGPRGSRVLCLSARYGGHYATASVARRLGFDVGELGVHAGVVNDDDLRRQLRSGPALVYLDLQNSTHILDVASVVAAVDALSPHTRVHVDCSHTMGLVLGGAHENPVRLGADSMGGSTHKTFPGPHKGVLMTAQADIAALFGKAQFDLLSSHHFAETLALGFAAAEFETFGPAYAHQTIANARVFAAELIGSGFDVVHSGSHLTDNHQVWVRIGDDEQTDGFARRLYAGGVRVNVQQDLPGCAGPTLRLGVNEVTFMGAREHSMVGLAEIFRDSRDGRPARLSAAVQEVRANFGTPFYFEDEIPPPVGARNNGAPVDFAVGV